MEELLLLACRLADESGSVIRHYFRSDFDVESKADATPVTVADRAAEAAMRAVIEKARPEDGILGEEYGPKGSKNGLTWVLDPIDGTKSFTCGRASFGTLIALCRDGVPVLGVIDQPILKERWAGAEGLPTTLNGKPVRVRSCPALKDARLASTSPSQIPDLWPKLYENANYLIWGGDCYSYGLVAGGWLDGVVEQGLAPYDFAALPPIIKGAGGIMCDWNGDPLTLESEGRTLAVGDAALKDQVLDILKA